MRIQGRHLTKLIMDHEQVYVAIPRTNKTMIHCYLDDARALGNTLHTSYVYMLVVNQASWSPSVHQQLFIRSFMATTHTHG
jgi:hypothetical protein